MIIIEGTKVKKVLFIACLYPPIANSGTQRSVKFTNYLPDYGWEPTVLTVENAMEKMLEPALLQEVRPGTRIERVPFMSDLVARKIGKIFRLLLPEVRVAEGLSWRFQNIWKCPDLWATWRPTAVRRAVELFQIEEYDCIFATGFPWTSFLVARDIAQRTGKPYVLDFRDLWTSWEADWDSSSRFVRWLSNRQELIVVRDASAIITVSDTLARVLTDMLPISSECPVVSITNGYDPVDFQVEQARTNSNGKVRIVYTGVWKAGYSPKALYDAMQLIQRDFPDVVQRLDVLCAGFPPGSYGQNSLDNMVQELGRVAHSEAIALMKSADALFLPVAEGDYAIGSLPGKLFEYLGSGKPIIAVVPAESEVAQVLNRIGGAIRLDPGDINGLAKVLVDIAQAGGPTWGISDPSLTACYKRRYLTSKLAEVLSSVSKTQ